MTSAVLTTSANEIILAAFLDSGITRPDQVPSAEDIATGLSRLNSLTKRWQADGYHLWSQTEGVVFANQGQRSYELGPGGDFATNERDFVYTTTTADLVATDTTIPVEDTSGMAVGDQVGIKQDDNTRFWTTIADIPDSTTLEITDGMASDSASGQTVFTFTDFIDRPLRIYNERTETIGQGNEIPSYKWTRQQYMQQTIKDSQGTMINMYYSPQLGDGRLYVWQVAADCDQVARFTYDRPLQVSTTQADAPDFPSEWFDCLKWNLAEQLLPGYTVPADIAQQVKQNAVITRDEALGFDEETGSLFIQPTSRNSRG